MRPDTILVNVSPGETRIALLARDKLVQLFYERAGERPVEGAIFAGRVTEVNNDLNAAFVDIGGDQPGFLGAADSRAATDQRVKSIREVVKAGDKVLVQADREALDGKGPRLTCRLVLRGRFMALRLGDPGLKFSRFVARAERDALGRFDETLPGDAGLSFEPAVGGAGPEELDAELLALFERRDELRAGFEAAKPPALLAPGLTALQRALCLSAPGCRIVSDDPTLGVEPWRGPEPLFEAFDVEAAVDALMDPVVALPSGGRVILSETPALVAVDVDAGATTGGSPARLAQRTNKEAATAIARELRRRNLAGQIVVDFLAMKGKKERQELLNHLRNALSADPVECHVLGFTPLGLVELTRRRRGVSLPTYLSGGQGAARPFDRSPETVALAALRGATAARGGRIVLRVPPAVARTLDGPLKGAFEETAERLGGVLTVQADPTLAADRFEFGE